MAKYSINEIRNRFANGRDFNEIFDAFEAAINQKISDVELYKLLFWNTSLKADERCLFGEKLAQVYPNIAYDVFMWLAKIFETTYSNCDNYELAMRYYRKAAKTKPEEIQPYINAADCFDADLNIPPLYWLTEFLKLGINTVKDKITLLRRLASLYTIKGNQEQSEFYNKLADELEQNKN